MGSVKISGEIDTIMRFNILPLLLFFITAQSCALFINDFSQLNRTAVSDIVYPTTVAEIQAVLSRAKGENKKISVAGKRHSQGGHAFCPQAIVIDMCRFNRIINLNVADKVITVQTGATWDHIQHYINQYGLAIKVMQTAEIFTIGGSLSVNAHGRDPRFGPLIETVRAVRILLASGVIVEASRVQHYDLFKLAIGGYGLFGIILEADIELTENTVYQKSTHILKIDTYASFVKEQVVSNPQLGLHYGIVSVSPYNFLKDMIAVNYVKHPIVSTRQPHVCVLRDESNIGFSQMMLNLQRTSPFCHYFSRIFNWPTIIMRESGEEVVCRNNAMRHPTGLLEYTATSHVHALCSYFIPPESFACFMNYLRNSCKTFKVRCFAVFTRFIPSNMESFLSYTSQERIEVVIFLVHKNSPRGIDTMRRWTQATVDYVLAHQGTYYLPGNLHPTYNQINAAYPHIAEFFAKKKEYDPSEIFANHFYLKYSRALSSE